MEELLRYTKALMLLQLQSVQQLAATREEFQFRPELLLADAGFGSREIAIMLDKTPAAVAKAISRARAARKNNQVSPELVPSDGGAQ